MSVEHPAARRRAGPSAEDDPPIELDAAAAAWQADGWVLVPELIPTADVGEALGELADHDLPASPATSPSRRRFETDDGPDAGGPAFRRDQFSGTSLFPVPGAPRLNRLFVHPRLVRFAERVLQTEDIRIYQSRIWSKYAGRVDYEQPLHRDLNHSLVPTRSEPGWWHLECFVYLNDVAIDTGAPRLVPRSKIIEEPVSTRPQPPEAAEELYAAEVAAPGPAGSVLAYRSDVWHRGTDITRPGAERHVLVVAFKPAGLDWIGYDPHPPLSINADFIEFVAGSTPRDLALFGVPPPNHSYWTAATIEAMAAQYPGLDLDPWRAGLPC